MTENELELSFNPLDYGIDPTKPARGFEKMRQQDTKLKTLRLCNFNTPEAKLRGDDPRRVEPGNFIYKTGEDLGNAIQVIFLAMFPGKGMFDAAGKLMHNSMDAIHCNPRLPRDDGVELCANCDDGRWHTINGKKQKPKCGDRLNYTTLLADRANQGPSIFQFKGYGQPVAIEMNSKMEAYGADMFQFVVELTSKLDQQGAFEFYVPRYRLVRLMKKDDPTYQICEALYTELSKRQIDFDEDDAPMGTENNENVAQNTGPQTSHKNVNDIDPEDRPF